MSRRKGQGRVFRPTYTYRGKRHENRVWWIQYSIGGQQYRESSGSVVQKDAVRLLHERLAERGQGIARRDLEKVKLDDLADLIRADYRKNNRKSISTLEGRLAHLEDAFGGWRVVDIQEDAIDRHAVDRLDAGAKPASVNRELAALRRMFTLGRRAKMVGRVPVIEMLGEDNVRKGFVEADAFAAILGSLPGYVRPVAAVGFITGWRRGELLSRRWRHVDLDAGWLRLEPGESKNKSGRNFPLIPELRSVLEDQHKRKTRIEQATGRIVDALFFHDNGRPVKDFRGAWEGACERAGHPGILFHDLKRSSARNLVRAGVPEAVAMRLIGHLTPSIFKRYAIVDEAMLIEGAEKLSGLYKGVKPVRKVLPLER